MFGCRAAYLDGKMVMVLAENAEDLDWNGVLLPTEREFQESLIADYPLLTPHKILPKWLYLSFESEGFEELLMEFGERIMARDPRFGTLPKPKRSKRVKKAK
jgi:hypothetical protein